MNKVEFNVGMKAEARRRGKPDSKAWSRWRRSAIRILVDLADWGADAFYSEGHPGDLLNLAYAFSYVFGFETGHSHDVAEGARILAERLQRQPAMLEETISRLRKLLAAVADSKPFKLEIEPNSTAIFDGASLRGGSSLITTVRSPDLEQSVTLAAMVLLGHEEGAMVRRCARTICGRIFLAARPKQVYCGRQCVSAANFERYKKKIGSEAYKSKHREIAKRWARNRRQRKRTKAAKE